MRLIKGYLFVFCILFSTYYTSFAQKEDTNTVLNLINLSFKNWYTNTDSAKIYAFQALKYSQKLNYLNGLGKSYNCLGVVNNIIGDLDKSLEYYLKALEIREKIGNKNDVAKTLSNIGLVYNDRSEYSKALEYLMRAQSITEIDLKETNPHLLLNIGSVYQNNLQRDKAFEYFTKALSIAKKEENKNLEMRILINIGAIYFANDSKLYNITKAIQVFENAYKVALQLNEIYYVSKILNNLGQVYFMQGNYEKAQDYFFKAAEAAEETGDINIKSIIFSNIARTLLNLNKANAGEKYIKESIKLANESNSKINLKDAYSIYTMILEKQGKFKEALEYYKLSSNLKDTIYNQEKEKDIAKRELSYEYQKKQLADSLKYLEEQKIKDLQISEQKAKIKQEETIKYAFGFGFLLLALMLGILFQSFNQKKKANVLLTKQKEEIAEQNFKLEEQKMKIEAINVNLSHLNDQLAEKNKDITDSIHYAKRIQEALLSGHKILQHSFPEFFIMFRPRDIVSGDYYYANSLQGRYTIFSVADCTGHGVPGAFMSLLGISFLNEIITDKRTVYPDEILNQLRHKVISSVSQDEHKMQKDGMDMALCVVDHFTNKLYFAGANNSLIIIRNGEIIDMKADKMPVGLYGGDMVPFTLKEFDLTEGDCLYMHSDGYPDQFGGPKGKKFKSSQIKEMLLNIHTYSMESQKAYVEDTFDNWTLSYPQIDDVTLMGVKIGKKIV
jgi:serine phosphatase RsbU (regulator of sigma subunit)/Tfp pilus assembly protein PilF